MLVISANAIDLEPCGGGTQFGLSLTRLVVTLRAKVECYCYLPN
jgi:hypothetical protein